jgi:hypothetical protein
MRPAALIVAFSMMLPCLDVQAQGAPQAPEQQPSRPEAPGSEEPAHVAPRLNLTLEQRHMIREIIKDLNEKPSSTEVAPAIGEPVPKKISLQPMPREIAQKVPQIKSHMFFLTPEQIVIFDPKDNKVAELIKVGAD